MEIRVENWYTNSRAKKFLKHSLTRNRFKSYSNEVQKIKMPSSANLNEFLSGLQSGHQVNCSKEMKMNGVLLDHIIPFNTKVP